MADDSAGPTNVYRHDGPAGQVALTDGHGHAQTLRRWGNWPVEIVERGGGVTRQEFDGRGHLVRHRRPGRCSRWPGTTPTGWSRSRPPGAPPVLLRAPSASRRRSSTRRAGHRTWPAAGAGRHRPRRRHGPAAPTPTATWSRPSTPPAVWRGSSATPPGSSAVVTPAGRRTELVHDGHGRLVERRGQPAWRYEYSAAGRRTAVVDPTGSRTETSTVRTARPRARRRSARVSHPGVRRVRQPRRPHTEAEVGVPARRAVAADGLDRPGRRHLVASTTSTATDRVGRPHRGAHADHLRPGRPGDRRRRRPGGHRDRVRRTGPARRRACDTAGRVGIGHSRRHHPHAGLRPVRDGDRRDRAGRRDDPLPYSAAGRLARVEAPSGRTERHLHDAAGGWPRWWTVPGSGGSCGTTPTGCSSSGSPRRGSSRPSTATPPAAVVRHHPRRGTTACTYDPAGARRRRRRPGRRREFTRDAAGRVVAATDALGHTTLHLRGGNLPRSPTRSAAAPSTSTTRSPRPPPPPIRSGGRPVRLRRRRARAGTARADRRPAPVDLRRVRTAAQRHRTSGRRDAAVAVERDALARPVRITESGAHPPIELRWDAAGGSSSAGPATRSSAWSYDADGLRTALTHPDGTVTSYRRDGAGRVVGWRTPLGAWTCSATRTAGCSASPAPACSRGGATPTGGCPITCRVSGRPG